MEVTSDDAGLTYKQAQTAAERRRVEHEADMLRRVAHPGVVQLLGTQGEDRPEALVLRTVSGGDLSALGAQPLPVIAGLGAALATTVADLHALGFCHGGIEASHVLLDDAGRPVLCSLSRSASIATSPDAARLQDDDLEALATMLLQLLPPDRSVRVARILRGVGAPGRGRPRRDAAWLARHLMATVPDARLPDPGQTAGSASSPSSQPTSASPPSTSSLPLPRPASPPPSSSPPSTLPLPRPASPSASSSSSSPLADGEDGRADRPGPLQRVRGVPPGHLVGAGVGFCILIAGAALLANHAQATDRSPTRVSGQVATPCPTVDDSCVPIPVHAGILVGPTGRYQVGQPGDVVVLGRWGCSPKAFPALLRPGTGNVWTFDAWPTPAAPVIGRLVAHVASAWSLQVLPGPRGCDRLEIDRRDLPPLTVAGVVR